MTDAHAAAQPHQSEIATIERIRSDQRLNTIRADTGPRSLVL